MALGEEAVVIARVCGHTGGVINTVYDVTGSGAGLICNCKSMRRVHGGRGWGSAGP